MNMSRVWMSLTRHCSAKAGESCLDKRAILDQQIWEEERAIREHTKGGLAGPSKAPPCGWQG